MKDEVLSVDYFRQVIAPHGLSVVEVDADTSTAPLAAEALGTPVATIVKSLLFIADDSPVLVLAAGNRRADPTALALECGAGKVRLATPVEVLSLCGYAVGGVPPIGHRRPITTLMDRTLLEYDTVFAAAGASNALFPVEPRQLVEITGARLTDATK